MIRKTIAPVLAVILILLIAVAPTAAAQIPDQGISLQISPLPIELSSKPGTTTSTDLRVRNAGSEPEKLQVHLLAVNEDDNGGVHLTEPQATDEWTQWVSFSRNIFDAPPGLWQTTHMTVAIPDNAAFGYYFAVEFRRVSDATPQPGQTAARGAVATFVLLNADSPGAKREAEVVAFTANQRLYEFLPASFTVKIRSTGNVHVAPHGNIFITRGKQEVDNIAVNAAEGNVLPHGSRIFTTAWKNGFPHFDAKTDAAGQTLPDKNGLPQMGLTWDFAKANRLRIGHYSARLVMVYDNGQRDVPLEAQLSFWVVPWRIFAVLGIILLFAILGMGATFWRLGKFAVLRTRRVKTGDPDISDKPV